MGLIRLGLYIWEYGLKGAMNVLEVRYSASHPIRLDPLHSMSSNSGQLYASTTLWSDTMGSGRTLSFDNIRRPVQTSFYDSHFPLDYEQDIAHS